jgi:hypothetical protein
MAWLKVSFPPALGATEELASGGLAWREAVRFAERECPLFFTEDFRDVGRFIGSLLQTAQSNGASIDGAAATVNNRRGKNRK